MTALCSNCKTGFAKHSAVGFPSVNLCYPCVRDFLGWLAEQGLADGNPLVAALWYVPPAVWIRSDSGGYTWQTIRGFKLVPA